MRLKSRLAYFLAFTAAYAVLAGFVFWGAWGLSACPVMPDAAMSFPDKSPIIVFWHEWLKTGKFAPCDLRHFIGSPYLWQELQYAIAGYLSALGMAYYLRGRGLSRLASYGGGIFLGFCGYWFSLFSAGHAGWFYWQYSGVFAFGLADRAVRKGKIKNWVLLGASVAWASFYQPDLWLLFTLFTAAYFIWCCVRERKLPSWKGLSAAAIVFFLIGAPSFRTAITRDLAGRDKQIEESRGSALTGGMDKSKEEERWIFVTNWSLPPDETLEFFIPRLNGDTSCPMVLSLGPRQHSGVKPYTGALGRPFGAKQGNYRQHSLYVGWVTCLMALFAVATYLKRRISGGAGAVAPVKGEIAFLLAAAIIFWLLSMGRYASPIYRMVFALPIGDSIRAPVKWHHLTEFALCALAGFGLEALIRKLSALKALPRRVPAIIAGALILLGACDLARINRLYLAVIDLAIVKAPNPVAEEIVSRGNGKVLDMAGIGNSLPGWGIGARGVEFVQDPSDPATQFALLHASQLKNAQVSSFLKSAKAMMRGSYRITSKAIVKTNSAPGDLYLFEFPEPKAKREVPPAGDGPVPVMLGIVSFLATIGAGAFGIAKS